MMNEMDPKGTVLNVAFAVSVSFILADHLAFTLAFDATYLWMMIGKLVSGFFAIAFSLIVYKRTGSTVVSEER